MLFTWFITAFVVAAKALPSLSEPAASAPNHACGDLIRKADHDGYARAIDVYNCWITVPFNPAVGTRFVKYWNDTLQFQGTLEYLKQPPPGYQQPAVDLIEGLNEIQHTIDAGGFVNEYQFEAALQSLLYSAHDAHVSLNAGLLSSFYFGSTWGLTSVSLDGIQPPKVYLTDDLIRNQTAKDGSWPISAISHINGTDVIDYLTHFAALNSHGTLEPHADWNLLFSNPVIDVLDDFTSLWEGGTTFYPGDTFTYTFEDGSTLDDEWLAVYYNPGKTGPLETGGDFYNFFVLGFYPASYNQSTDGNFTESNATANASSSRPVTHFANDAFPKPDVWQDDLTETGFITGYFLRDESLAVLSIPTFYAYGDAIQSFTDTVDSFITQAKAEGLKKVVIDLQQNEGGAVLLAYSVFKLFFPSIEPFAGSNMREHQLANLMGDVITRFYQAQDESSYVHQSASADEWIAVSRINADTGRNFTSWDEMRGQMSDDVDSFTSTIRLNTSNYLFDYSASGQTDPPQILFKPYSGDAPFAAENILMLSDGLCGSTCALFMEMMHWDAGVKNVVAGGRPSYGPMQTPSGSRAARSYGVEELDIDIANTLAVQTDQDSGLDDVFPDRTNQDVYVFDAGISLRNQVREGETVPLQMQFEAADCRIFYTPLTFNNFTNLWKYAADAIWTNPDLCVEGSTGFATSKDSTPKPAPELTPLEAVNYSSIGLPQLHRSGANVPFLFADEPLPNALNPSSTIARPPPDPFSKLQSSNGGLRLKPNEQVTPARQQTYRPTRSQLPNKPLNRCSAPPCRKRARRSLAGLRGGFDRQ